MKNPFRGMELESVDVSQIGDFLYYCYMDQKRGRGRHSVSDPGLRLGKVEA